MGVEQATQGPWKHNDGNPTRVIGPDDETVAIVYGGTVGIDQQFTNAGLVAATPPLYEYVSGQAAKGEADAKQIIDSLTSDGSPLSTWRYDAWNPRRIVDSDSINIASVFGGMNGDAVQLANAQLIASAPAMRDYAQAKAGVGDEAAQTILSGIGGA
jgi:hypothetical protein